jgi:hypothetical protein
MIIELSNSGILDFGSYVMHGIFYYTTNFIDIAMVRLRVGMLLFLILCLILILNPVNAESVTATIKSKTWEYCSQVGGDFSIPDGKTASNFEIIKLDSGHECYGPKDIKEKGFAIFSKKNDNELYSYFDNGGGSPWESTSLKSLTLPSGKYYISLDGGDEAIVKLNYQTQGKDDSSPSSSDSSSGTLFTDDFSSNLNNWKNTQNAKISNGQLAVTNNEVMETSHDGSTWKDYTLESDVTITNSCAGLVFRKVDDSNYYMWQLGYQGKLRPHKKVNGKWTVIKEVDAGLSKNNKYHVKIIAKGPTIKTYINGNLIDTTSDSTFNSGNVGFRQYGSETGVFDNIIVKK